MSKSQNSSKLYSQLSYLPIRTSEEEDALKPFLQNVRSFYQQLNYLPRHSGESTLESSVVVLSVSRVGRVPLEIEFPEIVAEVENVLSLNGYAAHRRRQTSHDEHFGTTTTMLIEHLLDIVPGLREKHPRLHRSTILHLFEPPKVNTDSALRYKRLIHARPYKPRNDDHPKGAKFQFVSSQVRTVFELLFSFPGETISFSNDNKNKCSIGNTCVSRLNRAKKWFLNEQIVHLPTHDYPKSFSIVPSGYLVMRNVDEGEQSFVFDSLSRKHVAFPRSGEVFIVNRPNTYAKSRIQSHILDMKRILEGRTKSVVGICVDRGPDNTWKGSLINIIQYGALWYSMKLQVLIVHGYSPDNSAFNPIERIFSTAAADVTGLVLKDEIDGQVINGKSDEAAIKQLYDLRCAELCRYFNGKRASFKIDSTFISCDDCQTEATTIAHDEWRSYVMSPGAKSDEKKNEFIRFLMDHLDKRKDLLCFSTCRLESCPHCSLCPNYSPRFMDHFRNVLRSTIPFPLPSAQNNGHFATYLELAAIYGDESQSIPDLSKSPDGKLWEYCTLGRHHYFYDSEADRNRHIALCHAEDGNTRTNALMAGDLVFVAFATIHHYGVIMHVNEEDKKKKKKRKYEVYFIGDGEKWELKESELKTLDFLQSMRGFEKYRFFVRGQPSVLFPDYPLKDYTEDLEIYYAQNVETWSM